MYFSRIFIISLAFIISGNLPVLAEPLERSALLQKDIQKTVELEKEIRLFILTTYSSLANDVLTGEGENLTSLFNMLGISKNQRQAQLPVLKTLLLEQTELFGFAQAVCRQYIP